MFKPVSPRLNITIMEEEAMRFWKLHRIFEKSAIKQENQPEYVFYEGPPTANGLPGVHHALSRAFKDIFPRYRGMQGYHVIRRGGWDTHGLPVEIGVEKSLGFTNKSQIEEYGVAAFNELCRKSAFEYIQEWERFSDRLGFWVDNGAAYVTYTNEYIESVWWILKTFWDHGLIYQGYKIVPFCPRCGTPLSDHEVALGYDEAVDPSLFVRFPLVDDPGTSLLVWTTTPWTLPGNVAVAAQPDVEYVIIERDLPEGGTEKLILAKALVEKVFAEEPVRVYETFKGRKLKDLKYRPLFTFLIPDKPAYRVIMGDFVTTEDGTGLVHIAPAFGADDMQASIDQDLPILMTVAENGSFINEIRPWRGMWVKDADPLITRDLENRGLLYRSGTITHTYPFCWRCSTPLLYYARSTWYIRTSQYKERMVELNRTINWVPEHIRDGRFGNWLENNVDWALGRERYWGTPLPVWECESCRSQLAVGSIAELSKLAGRDLTGLDLHRPYIDQVIIPCPECDSKMRRVAELIDVWFDSGSMPVAQWHYPFENEEIYKKQTPADFISEGVDQTRGWFYSLHAIATMLFDRVAFKNVIALGLVLDGNGQKMSKSRFNVIDPWEVLNLHGADAFRWYLYTAAPPGQERRFSVDLVGEVVRNFTLRLWNVYSFFVTYANIDGWKPAVSEQQNAVGEKNHLDCWILSELNVLIKTVTNALENYDVPNATRPIQVFVDNLSNWYLRRSRRRFWKSGSNQDKDSAYTTLYETLITLSKLLAPSMPFLAEEMYQNLVRQMDPNAPESVHLSQWPQANAALIEPELNSGMELVMRLASLGHAARNQAAIKVRQPLAEAAFAITNAEESRLLEEYSDLLADELNVKQVRPLDSANEAVSYRLNPLPKQLGQKYKNRMIAVRQAILTLDTEGAAQSLLSDHPVTVEVDGEILEILPDEVEVQVQARSGLAVATEGAYLCALSIELTPDLIREGLAREFVRRVQDLRKQAEFEIADRIQLYVEASPDLRQALEEHRDYIMGETLSVHLYFAMPTALTQEKLKTVRVEFDGQDANLGIIKAARDH